jgi:hypothetical protein
LNLTPTEFAAFGEYPLDGKDRDEAGTQAAIIGRLRPRGNGKKAISGAFLAGVRPKLDPNHPAPTNAMPGT